MNPIQGPSAGPGAAEYTKNAQQVGAQRDAAPREAQPPVQEDSIDLGELSKQKGAQSGAQTGQAQDTGKKETKTKEEGTPKKDGKEQKTATDPQVPLFMNDLASGDPASVMASLGGSQKPPGNTGSATPGPVAPPASGANSASNAQMAQMAQRDAMQANDVYMQMAAERQKKMWETFQMMQRLQADIMKIISDVAAYRTKMMDSICAKWTAVIGGYDK